MKLVIPYNIHKKIMHFVNKADFEVSGFGKVTHTNGVLTVIDVILLKQEGGAAHTDIDPAALGKAMYELRNSPGDLNFWWHSHVKMQAFWSGQDLATIDKIAQNGYCVATVFNQKNEHKSAFSGVYTDPFGERSVVLYDNITTEIEAPPQDLTLVEAWDKEFQTNVSQPKTWRSYSGPYDDFTAWDTPKAQRMMFNPKDKKYLDRYYSLDDFEATADFSIRRAIHEDSLKVGMTPMEMQELYSSGSTDEIDMLEAAINAAWGSSPLMGGH